MERPWAVIDVVAFLILYKAYGNEKSFGGSLSDSKINLQRDANDSAWRLAPGTHCSRTTSFVDTIYEQQAWGMNYSYVLVIIFWYFFAKHSTAPGRSRNIRPPRGFMTAQGLLFCWRGFDTTPRGDWFFGAPFDNPLGVMATVAF